MYLPNTCETLSSSSNIIKQQINLLIPIKSESKTWCWQYHSDHYKKNCISRPHATFLQKPPRVSISNLSQGRYPWNPWNQKASIYSPQGFQANSSKGQIFHTWWWAGAILSGLIGHPEPLIKQTLLICWQQVLLFPKDKGRRKFGAQSFRSFLLRRKKLSRFQLPSNVSPIKYRNTLSYSW